MVLLKRQRDLIILCGVLFLCTFLVIPALAVQAYSLNTQRTISLQIAALQTAKTKPTMLACILYNGSQQEFETIAPKFNNSQIMVSLPDGNIISGGVFAYSPPAVIQPGETKIWMIDLSTYLSSYEFDTAGLYQIYWQIDDLLGANKTKFTLKSNTLSLIKGKQKLLPNPSISAPAQLAFVLSSDPLQLVMSRPNLDQADTTMPGLLTAQNTLIIETPDGTKVDASSFGQPSEAVTVGPGQVQTWRIKVNTLLDRQRFTQPGLYQIYWKYTTTDAEGKASEFKSTPLVFQLEDVKTP